MIDIEILVEKNMPRPIVQYLVRETCPQIGDSIDYDYIEVVDGVSRTMIARGIVQACGYGNADDIVRVFLNYHR